MPTEEEKIVLEATKQAKIIIETADKVAKQLADGNNSSIALLAQTVCYIQADIKEIKESLKDTFVTRPEFIPVRTIAYSLVGLVCAGAIGLVFELMSK
jgi:hypothetical protein